MKFKIFVGWQVRVCSNLMLTTDGFTGAIECMTEADIMQKSIELFGAFNPHKEDTLELLGNLKETPLTEEQFCKIIGRLRLYQFLPASQQRRLPSLQIGDQAVNAMVKGYVSNPDFGKKEGEEFTCWNLLQLATEAVKSAYINCWLERNQNCTDFVTGIQNAIRGNDTEGYGWFLSYPVYKIGISERYTLSIKLRSCVPLFLFYPIKNQENDKREYRAFQADIA